MNLQRVQADIQRASAQFPNLDVRANVGGEIFVKAALQTTVGKMYVVSITFAGYPSAMPKVMVLAPAVQHNKHMYTSRHICFMHPSVWNPAKHDLLYVIAQVAVWLNKHEIYLLKGTWPGPGIEH